MVVNSTDRIEGIRGWSYHFYYTSEIERSQVFLKILLFFYFGIFKCREDGGLKHTSFYTTGGCELIFQDVNCIIADCVLPPVFFTLGLVPVSTSRPSQQVPLHPQLRHFHSLPVFIHSPRPMIPTFLLDLASVLSCSLPPPYFMSGSHHLFPVNSSPHYPSLLPLLSRLHSVARMIFHNQIWYHFPILILCGLLWSRSSVSSLILHHIFAYPHAPPHSLHHLCICTWCLLYQNVLSLDFTPTCPSKVTGCFTS